jgi:putative transposase
MIGIPMSAEVDSPCGAGCGERVNTRNGYRSRLWDTRVGSKRTRDPHAAARKLLPGLVAAAAAPGGKGAHL